MINFPPYAWIENDRVLGTPDHMLDTSVFTPIKEGGWDNRLGPAVESWDPYDNGPEWFAYDRDVNTGHWSAHPLRGAKRDLYEGGHRVPTIIRWPGILPEGAVNEALLSQIDFMATIAAIPGVDLPDGQAVVSFNQLPVLLGQQASVRDTHAHNTFKDQLERQL